MILPNTTTGNCDYFPPKVLHGVTQLTRGTRKSLFLVDRFNGLGEAGIVMVTTQQVKAFLAARASLYTNAEFCHCVDSTFIP